MAQISTDKPIKRGMPVSRSNGGVKRLKNITKQVHRYIGASSAVFIFLLSVSGLLLHYPGLLGGEAEKILSMVVDPEDYTRMFKGTNIGLYLSRDGGESWDEVPMMLPAENVVDIAFAPDETNRIYAAMRDFGVIRSDDSGRIWENLNLPLVPAAEGVEIRGLALGPKGTIWLNTSQGALLSSNAGKTWNWVEKKYKSNGLWDVVHSIHTGYFFGKWFTYVYDAAAVGLVLLIGTGMYIWRKTNGRN